MRHAQSFDSDRGVPQLIVVDSHAATEGNLDLHFDIDEVATAKYAAIGVHTFSADRLKYFLGLRLVEDAQVRDLMRGYQIAVGRAEAYQVLRLPPYSSVLDELLRLARVGES